MKMSRTTLKELKSRYSDILKKCAILNAFLLPALAVSSAFAGNNITSVSTENIYEHLVSGVGFSYDAKASSIHDHHFVNIIDETFTATDPLGYFDGVVYGLYKKVGDSNFNFYGVPTFADTNVSVYGLKKVEEEQQQAYFDEAKFKEYVQPSGEGVLGGKSAFQEATMSGTLTGHGSSGYNENGGIYFMGFTETGEIADSISFKNNKLDIVNLNHARNPDEMDSGEIAQAFGGAFYNAAGGTFGSKENTRINFISNTASAKDSRINSTGGEHGEYSYTTAQGGALWNNATLDFKGEVNFQNNEALTETAKTVGAPAYSAGGAVYNGLAGGSAYFGDTAVFEGNHALNLSLTHQGYAFGGAVANQGDMYSNSPRVSMTFDKDAHFKNNVAQAGHHAYGGALYNDTADVSLQQTEFKENKAVSTLTSMGGAVYNGSADVKFADKGIFEDNLVSAAVNASMGGAVAATESKVSFADADFKNNQAVASYGFLNGEKRWADALGGAVYIGDNTTAEFTGNMNLQGNKATATKYAEGGAISSQFGDMTFKGTAEQPVSILFKDNQVESTYTGALTQERIASRGGALSNSQGNVVFDENTNATFTGNKAVSGAHYAKGGAIYNSGTMQLNGTAEFFQNSSDGDGGAIYNAKELTLAGPINIHDNTAQMGGAIYNSNQGVLNLNSSDITIANNTAQKGGNLYNTGEVNVNNVQDSISQTAKTAGHTIFDQESDIYNEGVINIRNSNLILGGGVNISDKAKKGTINVFDNATLDVGMGEIYAQDINFNEGSTFGATITGTSNGRVNAENISIADENTALKLTLGLGTLAVGETKTYTVLSADNEIANDFTKILQNNLYKIEADKDNIGSYKVTRLGEGVGEIIGGTPGTDTGTGEETGGTTGGEGTGSGTGGTTGGEGSGGTTGGEGTGGNTTPTNPVNPKDPYCPSGNCNANDVNTLKAWVEGDTITDNDTAHAIQEKLFELAQWETLSGNKAYREAVEALQSDTTPLIQMHETEILRRLASMTEDRLSGSFDRTAYTYRGRLYGKRPSENSNLWIQGVYGKSKYNKDRGWDLDTTGVAVGVDGHIDPSTRVGIGYAYTKSTGDSMSRDTDIESNTGFVYGEYNPNRFYVNGLALYTTSKYDEKKKILGFKAESDYDVNAYGGQIMMGYKLGPVMSDDGWATGVLKPEMGVRYLHVDRDSYKDTLGQQIGKASSDTVTGVLGVGYTVLYKMAPDFSIYPELKVAATYDFVEPDTDTRVVMSNGSTYKLKGDEDMKRLGAEVALRLGMDIARQAEIGLEYDGMFRGDYTNHTGMANMKYNF